MSAAVTCSICGAPAKSRTIAVRSGKEMTLWHCEPCDFDFFAHDPTASLADGKLDESRLKAAGLEIPPVEKDFANGLKQSQPYIDEYVGPGDKGRSVLEIGCSWGYFLQMCRDAGAKPYGVELNRVRTKYVNEKLDIPCDPTLEACEKRGIRFKKIFLLYVLEYVPNPVEYCKRLLALLDDDGEIVMVTPSLRDPLKDLWNSQAFGKFFYDEHAINYFAPRSVDRLIERVKGKAKVVSRQGYSFVNHVSWFLTNGPRTTGVVGGDNFARDILAQMRAGEAVTGGRPTDAADAKKTEEAAIGLAKMIEDFDRSYKRFLEERRLGNQIRISISR
jgi:hypothetical protein